MTIFALNPAKMSLNDKFVEQLSQFGEVVVRHEPMPILEVPGITDPSTDKILLISPLFSEWKLGKEILAAIPNLKSICLTSTSFGWVDLAYTEQNNIPVFNSQGYSTNAVAEGAMMMALNTARKIPMVIQNNLEKDLNVHLGMELTGKKAGVIGLGNIGKRIAELAKGFGMDVSYWSKSSRDERFTYQELATLMSESDCIFITLAQNDETTGLVTDEMLRSMKTNAIFISVVHKIYNHELLTTLAREGKIFGYAHEESEKMTDLTGNIWSGIPLIWYTREALDRNSETLITNIANTIKGDLSARVN